MTIEKINELKSIPVGTHLKLTPIDKFPEMDTDIVVDGIYFDMTWDDVISYGTSETCDGYAIPFSWIKDFEIITSDN